MTRTSKQRVRASAVAAVIFVLALAAPATRGSVAASGQAPALEVDQEHSILVVKLKKAGLLRFLGHEHGIVPGDWSADVRFDPDDPAGSSITVEVPVGELVIDSDQARRLAGVDPDGPNEEEAAEIRADMLSDQYLDAEAFPAISFESRTLELRSDDQLRIEGTLTVHGISRQITVDAELARDGDGYVVRGDFDIGQHDFGIEPASIAGVVKVADEVEIRFEIYASPAR